MLCTFSGIDVDPTNLRAEDVNLIDIAHHLTNHNRNCGAFPFDIHYSVAEHSILLAQYVLDNTKDREAAAYALMHDASEAYLGDVNSDLKRALPDYVELEEAATRVIMSKYGIWTIYGEFVSGLDKRIFLNEVRVLTPERLHKYRRKGLELLSIKNLAVNDDDYGTYRPGTVPKQVVNDNFLRMCELLGIGD